MKKSEAAINDVLFTKAKEMAIDPLLFSSAIHYIIAHPKQPYGQHDITASIQFFADAVNKFIQLNAASMKPIFSGLDERDYVKTALLHFATKYGTDNFLATIYRNCKQEIRAVIDYEEMVNTGFSEEAIVDALERNY